MLANAKNRKLRECILKYCDRNVIQVICEIAFNTLNGHNTNIDSNIINKLKRYKKELRRISCPKLSIGRKRKIIIQRGGWIQGLIATVLAAIAAHKHFQNKS